jgi:hypothetical protein
MRMWRDTALFINNRYWLIDSNGWSPITKKQYEKFLTDLKNNLIGGGWVHEQIENQPIVQEKTWPVLSSNGKETYTVRLTSYGSYTCNCAGYTFRRKCRHIDEVKENEKIDCPVCKGMGEISIPYIYDIEENVNI